MKKELTFEESLRGLQETVVALEGSDKSLDELIELYKSGIEQAAACRKKLDEAKLSVSILGQEADNNE